MDGQGHVPLEFEATMQPLSEDPGVEAVPWEAAKFWLTLSASQFLDPEPNLPEAPTAGCIP